MTRISQGDVSRGEKKGDVQGTWVILGGRRGGGQWADVTDALEATACEAKQHCIKGLREVTPHALMSVVTFQRTVLAHLRAGRDDEMRWMVRRIA